jgi:hypothetical protein
VLLDARRTSNSAGLPKMSDKMSRLSAFELGREGREVRKGVSMLQ